MTQFKIKAMDNRTEDMTPEYSSADDPCNDINNPNKEKSKLRTQDNTAKQAKGDKWK